MFAQSLEITLNHAYNRAKRDQHEFLAAGISCYHA